MKKEVLIAVVGVIFLVGGYILGSFVPVTNFTGTTMGSDVDSFAYAAGIANGVSLMDFAEQSDFAEELSVDQFVSGIRDGFEENESKMTSMDAQMYLQQFVMKRQQVQQESAMREAEENLQAGLDFLEENKMRDGVHVTESGLQYEILTEGTGATPAETDTVEVRYLGTLIDGTEFDSSADDETATFAVTGVIKGWTEALMLMKEGSKWRIYVPSGLAYGPRQRSELIKPNSTLIFEIELLDVKGK